MIGLILTVIIGFGIAYFSSKSTLPIVVTIGDNTYFNIPLLVITVGTYLLGILIAWIIEIPQTIVSAFQIMGLGRTIKSGNNTISQLQTKINKLEMENIKLHEHNRSNGSDRQTSENYKPDIIHNILRRLNLG